MPHPLHGVTRRLNFANYAFKVLVLVYSMCVARYDPITSCTLALKGLCYAMAYAWHDMTLSLALRVC